LNEKLLEVEKEKAELEKMTKLRKARADTKK